MEQAGLKLNKEKCVYAQPELRFLGHIVDAKGIRVDPSKVSAIRELRAPTNVQELKRALGMINYMSKYIPDMATVIQLCIRLLMTIHLNLYQTRAKKGGATVS